MNLLQILKKIATDRMVKTDALFTYPIEKQQLFLRTMPQPVSDLQRSYFQYKAQMKRIHRVDVLSQNLLSVFLIGYYWIKIKSNPELIQRDETGTDAVFFQNGISDSIIPNSLREEFKSIKYCNYEDALLLTKEDRRTVLSIWKTYPADFYFTFKLMIKIAGYRAQMIAKSPKAVIVSAEYSITSSFLTTYLEKQGIQHINVMHGEKLYTISDSYFRFSRCYVWNQHYIQLFNSLNADKNQYRIEIPPALLFRGKKIEKKYFLKYYLADTNEEDMKKIAGFLRDFSQKGLHVAVRPHPRFTDMNLVKKIFVDIEIEESSVPIEPSILSTEYVTALFSTVLNQAYFNGVQIVIDDYTNKTKYEKLKELQYFIMEKEHKLLSELMDMQ